MTWEKLVLSQKIICAHGAVADLAEAVEQRNSWNRGLIQ